MGPCLGVRGVSLYGASPQRAGFSLVELLIAAGIASLIAGGITLSLFSGIAAWRRIRQMQGLEVAIALEQMASQFANSPSFAEIPFEGEPDRLAFPALVRLVDSEGVAAWTLGRRLYFLDEERQALCVRDETYGDFLSGTSRLPLRCLAAGVRGIELEYLRLDPELGTSTWLTRWEPTESQRVPWAIRATVVLQTPRGQEIRFVKGSIRPVRGHFDDPERSEGEEKSWF